MPSADDCVEASLTKLVVKFEDPESHEKKAGSDREEKSIMLAHEEILHLWVSFTQRAVDGLSQDVRVRRHWEFDVSNAVDDCVLALTYAVVGASEQRTANGTKPDVDPAHPIYCSFAAVRTAMRQRNCAAEGPTYNINGVQASSRRLR